MNSHALLVLSFLVGGCGHTLPRASSASVAAEKSAYPADAPATSESSGEGWRGAPSGDRGASASAPRAERPGLGTVWGERRVSRVRDVPFERAQERPFSITSIFYNDRGGVDAMSRHDRPTSFDRPVPLDGGLAISVVDESGSCLPVLSFAGRLYVVGEAGRRYSLRVTNQTARRYELVASVDGLDVVDGRRASLDKRGYVITPWGSLTIDGFRRSAEEVAAFRFGSVGESYASRSGDDRNVGVIGLALFSEQGASPWTDEEIDLRRTAEPFSDSRYAQPPR